MLDKIIEWDRALFLFLNGKNTPWLDPVMLFLSSYTNWVLASVVMTVMIYWKTDGWKKTSSLFFLLSVAASAMLTNIIKLIIERPRPIHNELWEGSIHAIERYSNSFSFFSSHSATTFAMAAFFFMFFRNNKVYGIIAFVWATLVAYSRIYVAKHYPMDVLVGIFFGTMIGILGYMMLERFKKRKDTPLGT